MHRLKKILLASANVLNDTGYLKSLKRERDAISNILSPAVRRSEVGILKEPECSFMDLFKKFNQPGANEKITILHYSGHSNENGLLLQHLKKGNQSSGTQGLAEFLKLQRGLEVVIFNSCYSDFIGDLLLEGNVGAVIETNHAVIDSRAARFSEWFYLGLYSGKNLIDAFNQAVKSYEIEYKYECQREDKEYHVRSLHFKQDSIEEFSWKLSFKDRSFVENWYLVERIQQKFYDFPTRVLSVYETNKENDKYHQVVKGFFSSFPAVYTYTLSDLLIEENKNQLIADTQIAFFIFTKGFVSFWNQLDWLKPYLAKMKIYSLGCDGDIDSCIKIVEEELNINNLPIAPSRPFSLNQLSQPHSLETAFNKICKPLIPLEIFDLGENIENFLLQELDNLNFGPQRLPFESLDGNAFQFGIYNLILIEGTPHCAQELLVKKLLSYARPRIEKNVKQNILSIENNILGLLTQEDLIKNLSDTLLKVKFNVGMDIIIKTIIDKLKEQDLIIIVTDVVKRNGDCLHVFKTFWNALAESLPPSSANRLFFFIVHKESTNDTNQWDTNGFLTEPPIKNVRLLDVIGKVNQTVLNSWHANAERRFPEGSIFHSIIAERTAEHILQEPYMEKVISKICEFMNCPNVLSKLLKF